MDWEEYRLRGKEMIDYIANYRTTIRNRNVYPSVKPGYLKALLPQSAPLESQSFANIMSDVENCIMAGLTHWQSPHMHAYFPALSSPVSMLGDMLADAVNCIGFTWASSPAATELEMLVMDWLAQMLDLPKIFLHSNPDSNGGGVIQTTASEATFTCLLAARNEAFIAAKRDRPQDEIEFCDINPHLVAYTSDQAHSSIEKAAMIGLVKIRYIESDDELSVRGDSLRKVILRDKEKGLIPFFFCATLGTTGSCAFDNLEEIGPICAEENIWLHIDAAYAGSAFICPEFRHWMKGIEYASSFAFNPSKWLMVTFDCTAMWIKNSQSLHRTFTVDPIYLDHEYKGTAVDYMHWQVPLSRRFRALKLWFVLRNFGVNGLQDHIRRGVKMAKYFEKKIEADKRFEIAAKSHLGLVVFRLKEGSYDLTEMLLKSINSTGLIHCVPASLKGKYVIRFTITSTETTIHDIERDYNLIADRTSSLLNGTRLTKKILKLEEIHMKNPQFGTSLLLINSPMIPALIDSSYVAILNETSDTSRFSQNMKRLRFMVKESPTPSRRFHSLVKTDRQFSLDSKMAELQTLNAMHPKSVADPCFSELDEKRESPR